MLLNDYQGRAPAPGRNGEGVGAKVRVFDAGFFGTSAGLVIIVDEQCIIRRHAANLHPGLWSIASFDASGAVGERHLYAVMDDFGTLVPLSHQLLTLINELADIARRHLNSADSHAETAATLDQRLLSSASPVSELAELVGAGARMSKVQARQLLHKLQVVQQLIAGGARL